jgi:hypothetical protein
MDSITISFYDILYNNFFLALITSLLSIFLLFIDRCIFIKKNNYITYMKLFLLVFIATYIVLLFKDTQNSDNTIDLDIDESPFK